MDLLQSKARMVLSEFLHRYLSILEVVQLEYTDVSKCKYTYILIVRNKNKANVYFLLKKSTIRLCKSSENLTLLYSQHNS